MTDNKTETGVRCVIVTPEMTILDTHSQSITVPLFDGLRGIARGHAPFIGRLGVGSVKINEDSGQSSHQPQSVFKATDFSFGCCRPGARHPLSRRCLCRWIYAAFCPQAGLSSA